MGKWQEHATDDDGKVPEAVSPILYLEIMQKSKKADPHWANFTWEWVE